MMNDELERQLMEVRKVNVIVGSFLNDANRGYMDREEALTRIVLALHDEGAHLKARIQSLMEKGVPPVVLNMSSADMEKITPILNAASEVKRMRMAIREASELILKLPTWVESNSYEAQVDMRQRASALVSGILKDATNVG